MKEYISREALIHKLNTVPVLKDMPNLKAMCLEWAKAIPAADVRETVSQAELEVLEAEKARADRLAEKVKTLETENVLLKDALHKMGTAAQKDNGETKRDMVNYLCTEMGGDCTDCPVRKNDLAYYICASKPFEEFTEAELDTLLACFYQNQ